MIQTDVMVIGGGPAGMNAALAAAESGAQVLLVDKFQKLGGQLVKQTHKFLGGPSEVLVPVGLTWRNSSQLR